jgi:hypothetical protein
MYLILIDNKTKNNGIGGRVACKLNLNGNQSLTGCVSRVHADASWSFASARTATRLVGGCFCRRRRQKRIITDTSETPVLHVASVCGCLTFTAIPSFLHISNNRLQTLFLLLFAFPLHGGVYHFLTVHHASTFSEPEAINRTGSCIISIISIVSTLH